VPFLQIFKIRFLVSTLIPFDKGQVASLANKVNGRKIAIMKKIALIFI